MCVHVRDYHPYNPGQGWKLLSIVLMLMLLLTCNEKSEPQKVCFAPSGASIQSTGSTIVPGEHRR